MGPDPHHLHHVPIDMTAASTIWMSGGWIASGPPATGTCQTMVMKGVDCCTLPAGQGGEPVIFKEFDADSLLGPQTSVRWCHWTKAP